MSKVLGFIKRNMRMVITISVAVLVIAGLSTALVVTNAGSSGRGGSRSGRAMAATHSERGEHRSERSDRASRGCGDEDCERGNRSSHSRVELTEEQIAERAEIARERLAQKLADDEITQDEYEERLAAIEVGDFRSGRNDRSSERTRGWCGDEDCERGNRTRRDSDSERVERGSSNNIVDDDSDDEVEVDVEDYDDSDNDDEDTNG